MDAKRFLEIVHLAEYLKDEPRHAYTSGGRRESVAEHCWRIGLMAFFLTDEFPQADMNRVIEMCLIHDLGEIFIGDIPAFSKTEADAVAEEQALENWVSALPEFHCRKMQALYAEMNAQQTLEAKIYRALDKLEAVIQHNESSLDTWEPLEYEMNRNYGYDAVAFSDYLKQLRDEIRRETEEKIARAEK